MYTYIITGIAIFMSLGGLVAWYLWLRQPKDTPLSERMALGLLLPGVAWLIAMLAPQPENMYQKGAIALGLIVAFLALALRLGKYLPAYVSHAHLVVSYALYATGFAARTTGWPTPWALPAIVASVGLFIWLWPYLAELREGVLVYGIVLLLALWQAIEMAVQYPDEVAGWAALIGMVLVCIAAVFEVQARFRPLRPGLVIAVVPILVIGHFAVAWSVWS